MIPASPTMSGPGTSRTPRRPGEADSGRGEVSEPAPSTARADRLEAAEDDRSGRPVFPAPLGGWRDPSNTQADLREAFAAAGFEWVTTHAFRKTVATLMDHAGLSSRAAADQLGHASTSMTTDVYFGRKVAITGAAAVLEALGS